MSGSSVRSWVFKIGNYGHKKVYFSTMNAWICDGLDDEHKIKFDLPYEQTANAFMSAKGYSEYVKKHGYYFTDTLAEYVSKMMENANAKQYTWTTSQVKKSMESLGLTIPGNVTHGDVTYLANMYYADLYPDPLKDEASCLRAAYKVANDPDGYEGMIFADGLLMLLAKP